MSEERPAARILAPGTRIGTKYVLVRRLATGGMGEVWLAQNETTQASVALKVLRPNTAEKALEAEERFRREARLAGLLTHRSIVRIFDFLEEPDGTLVLVMELLQGETLEQWLARRGARTER
ncbi:MAG: protein kinase domain-containing protein, partial [Polyangiaceae bacterium]